MSEKREEKIISVLSETPYLTTSEVSQKIGVSRSTGAKLLEVMRTKGIIDCRVVGPSNLWYIRLNEQEQIKRLQAELTERMRDLALKSAKKKVFRGATLKLIQEVLARMEKEERVQEKSE